MKITLISTLAAAVASTCSYGATLIDFNDGTPTGSPDPEILAGGFTGLTDGDPAPWENIGTGNAQFIGNLNSPGSGGTNFAVTRDRILAINTGYTIAAGDIFNVSYAWRDAANWDANDEVEMNLFFTNDDLITGTQTAITIASGGRDATTTWETEGDTGLFFVDPLAVGKTLFVSLGAPNVTQGEFSRMDDVFVEVISVPEPSSTALIGLAGLGLLIRRRA